MSVDIWRRPSHGGVKSFWVVRSAAVQMSSRSAAASDFAINARDLRSEGVGSEDWDGSLLWCSGCLCFVWLFWCNGTLGAWFIGKRGFFLIVHTKG